MKSTGMRNIAVEIDQEYVSTIDTAHKRVHDGTHYNVSRTADVTNGANDDIIISVPDDGIQYHMVFEITTESEVQFSLYEGAETSDDGTPISSVNRNRLSTNTSSLAVSYSPTVTTTGSLLAEGHWGSGRGVGGEDRGSLEWILANNTKYLARVTNATANNNQVWWKLDYYMVQGE